MTMVAGSGKNVSGSHDVAEESNEVIISTSEPGAVDDDCSVVDCEAAAKPTNCEMMTPSMVNSGSNRCSSSSSNNSSASEPKVQVSMEKVAVDGTSKPSLFLAHFVLYDAVTQRRMVDPVVNLAGDSYERSTVLQSSDAAANGPMSTEVFSYYYYPNRALASILKQQREYEQVQHRQQQQNFDKGNDETETTVEEMEDRLDISDLACSSRKLHTERCRDEQDTRHQLLQSSLPDAPPPPLPEAFYCPITCDIMVDPWIGPDGVTYDYDAIYEWLDQNENQPCSPVTREPLVLGQLRPNHALYELIQREIHGTTITDDDDGKQQHGRHASIQAWMDTTRCTQRPARRPNHPPPPPMGSPIWNKQRSYSWSSASSWYTSAGTAPVASNGSSMEQGRSRDAATSASSSENVANDANHWFSCSCIFTFVMLLTMAFVVIVFSSKLFLLVLLLFCAVVTTIKYMMRNDDDE